MKPLTAAILATTLTACASGYSQFYTPIPGETPDSIAATRAGPPPAIPLVDYSPAVPDPNLYARLGYVPIGYSSFNSGRSESEKGAIAQAQQVGADLVVVVNPAYTGSISSVVPITTPTTTTSHTTGSATAYGAGGSVTAYGNATTTTYGSRTNHIPMTVTRYDYRAVYFVKRTYVFGANWRDLTNDERAELQSNSGLLITAVVNDSPAFRNDVLAGDILVKIDGQPVYGQKAAFDAIRNKRGQEVTLTLYRSGRYIEKIVRLSQ